MYLEYFQMIDRVVSVSPDRRFLQACSIVPIRSSVYEGHFPNHPLVPGVLLIETMAQASGFLVLAATNFVSMPFLISVDSAKMRSFVKPQAVLDIEAELEHQGSGFAVTRARILSGGKRISDSQLKFRNIPFEEVPLRDVIKSRCENLGLMALLNLSLKDSNDGCFGK